MNKHPIIKQATALTAAFLAASTLAACGDKKSVPSDREVKALFITGLDGNAMPMGRKAGHVETPGEVTWVPKSEKVNVGGKSVTHHWSEAVYPTSVAITPESRDCPAFVGFTKEPGVFTDGSTTVLKRAACTPAEIEVEGNSTVHQRALFSVLGDVISVGVGVNFEIRDPDQTNINNQHSTSASSNQSSNNDLSAVAQQQQGQHQDQQQAQQQKQGQKQTSNNNNWNENNNNNWNENNNNNWNKNYNQQKTEYRGGDNHGGCGHDKHGRKTCYFAPKALNLG